MKTANISIDTAKAMYAQGGAAKKFALDNFTEQELTKKALPKTWDEASEGKKGWYIDSASCVSELLKQCPSKHNKNLWPTEELAEACLALSQLAVLRKAYRDSYEEGWEPDFEDHNKKHCICFEKEKIATSMNWNLSHFLSFPAPKLRDEFMSNFEALILKAQPLL